MRSKARAKAFEILEEPLWRARQRGRLLRPWRKFRFAAYGANSIIHKPTWIYGPKKIEIGTNVILMPGLWLAVERAGWDAPGPRMRIGNGVAVRMNCSISAVESVVIEDDVVMGATVTIVDSNHTWEGGVDNVMYNPLTSGPVRIGRGTWIGDRATILAGTTIGKFCKIGTGAVVRGEFPDYSVIVGAPARVVGTVSAPE